MLTSLYFFLLVIFVLITLKYYQLTFVEFFYTVLGAMLNALYRLFVLILRTDL